jgi:hypothetical protein
MNISGRDGFVKMVVDHASGRVVSIHRRTQCQRPDRRAALALEMVATRKTSR